MNYLVNSFVIKQSVLPGTEINDLFKDEKAIDIIRKFLDKFTYAINAPDGLFADWKNHDMVKQWKSPFKHRQTQFINQESNKS